MAIETHLEYGIVTYDLAVALKAYSIQTLDAPRFDKLLIMLAIYIWSWPSTVLLAHS